MSQLLRRLFRRKKTSGRNARRDRHRDVYALLGGQARRIIDGGANRGKMVRKFLDRYPRAEIHAFEPIPELVEVLRERFGQLDNVHIHATALGSENGTLRFHVTSHSPASSALEPAGLLSAYWQEGMDVVRTIEVPVVRMDEAVEGELDVVKLDLQGFELKALQGGTRLLPQTRVVLTEVEFVELYHGRAAFAEIDTFLGEQGFRLYNLYDLYTQHDGQLTHGDAVYLNTRYFPLPERPTP